jgi:hypothetical protein
VCVDVGKGQLVKKCPLELLPLEGEFPVVVITLLSLNKKPHFKTCKSLRKKQKIWSWVPTGPENKIYFAGEDQQQFNRSTD